MGKQWTLLPLAASYESVWRYACGCRTAQRHDNDKAIADGLKGIFCRTTCR
jgi:hypothetical protein